VCEKGQQDGKEDRRINPSAEDLDRSKIKPQLHHTQEKHGGGGPVCTLLSTIGQADHAIDTDF
jgi:hypothetical protein